MLFETEIKTALKAAGLNEDLYDQIKVETADEIEGAVKTLKTDMEKVKNFTEDEFMDAIKKAGMADALKKYTGRESDRRVNDAVKTHDEKLRKAAEDEAAKKEKEKGQETMTAEQKEIQSLKETIKTMGEEIRGISTTLSSGDLNSGIRAELKKAGLSESFVSDIKVDDPGKIAEAVSVFKGKFDAQQQENINRKLEAGELAAGKVGTAGQNLEESAIANFAKSLGTDGTVKNPDFPGKISSAKKDT